MFFLKPPNSYTPFCPVTAVEVPITNCLGDMHRLYFLAASEVSDGACHLEDAVIGTGRKFQPFHRRAEHLQRRLVRLGKLVEHALGHLSVAVDPPQPSLFREGIEALCLDVTGSNDPFSDLLAGFPLLHL